MQVKNVSWKTEVLKPSFSGWLVANSGEKKPETQIGETRKTRKHLVSWKLRERTLWL